ncbi:GT4 family glycosyltransferase PelF [Sulfitobacter sp. KE34]|uniref:GT4 family glycosyltransferase PelF n=1 Tax=unclassified Sulfitobacter TaxID=196795 RepID=UPI0023E2432F|nr:MULTISPECIES: GT4 family glycosyltransferase PelF [unclassified Sulfitobacter]MDF3351810.1 GT4 family glycosyltransferase PelF [Sulfitobacter sp. KE12]MDF3355482.1 GT4 family glycosyltransferase PelF [Sulfitobacter sp. KE27]MDF3359130.1 GT4 family glycosyltransferase PelF [Sulfitobacter sp. KE33]MDF3366554.1 GT4 family glycosyltransferase PelF [Sulfitobacter sp. Ks34]MDF3370163.1 GT4 family glycosyltransferase PelF [Sulfitobacter sp. Ks43]
MNTRRSDVCIVVEGCYPFVTGGVSSWLDWLIRTQPDTTFAVVAITADHLPRALKYELPPNVSDFQVLPLAPMPRRPRVGRPLFDGQIYGEALKKFWDTADVEAFETLCQIATNSISRSLPALPWQSMQPDHADFVSSQPAWEALNICARALAPEASFNDIFWAWRVLVGGLMSVLSAPLPPAHIYHAISTGYAGLYAVRAARQMQARSVITEHGVYTNERRIDLLLADWLEDRIHKGFALEDTRREVRDLWADMFDSFARVAYAQADRITALYGANQSSQRALGAKDEQMLIIPNGIDLEKFEVLNPARASARPTVGLVGRVVPIKDIENCIRAAAVIRQAVQDVEVLIIGPTDENPSYFEACERRVAELQLGGTVRFTGRMDVAEVLPSLDVLVLTSISEAQPLVLLEAGAARIPCVATDVGSCRDIIEGPADETPSLGRGGSVVPPMDPDALGAAVIQLLTDSALRKTCGEVLRKRVETSFTSEVSTEAYQTLYRELAL